MKNKHCTCICISFPAIQFYFEIYYSAVIINRIKIWAILHCNYSRNSYVNLRVCTVHYTRNYVHVLVHVHCAHCTLPSNNSSNGIYINLILVFINSQFWNHENAWCCVFGWLGGMTILLIWHTYLLSERM